MNQSIASPLLGFSRVFLAVACLLLAGTFFGGPPSFAFTVIKNVNSGVPPTEKVVIFDKARGAANQVSFVTDNCPTALNADGAIQADITGNAKLRMEMHWKPQPGLPATIDFTQYAYLLLTCRVEGVIHRQDPNGKVSDLPRGNLYLAIVPFDANDQGVGYANLADLTDDAKTPATTVTLTIPMVLFTRDAIGDARHVQGIGTVWGETHPNLNRDLHLVIDKIALAD